MKFDHTTKYALLVGALQILYIVLFALFTEYGSTSDTNSEMEVGIIYPFFQDVNVMVYVGFGFLMTFMAKYGYSGVGFNFMISTLMMQWSLLVNGFWHQVGTDKAWHKISLNIEQLIDANFSTAAVLISFGACLGKLSPLQLAVMGFWEIIICGANYQIGVHYFGAVDMGGSMFVHTFGAFFGLAFSWILTPKEAHNHKDNKAKYLNDIFATIGTLFLWMFWPSFNGALATQSQQFRVVINTVISLAASCSTAFLASCLFRKHRKFDMVDIQNATLAGGVAVGSSADLVIQPWGAALIGSIAGVVSTFGYVYLSPFFERKFSLHDTCGVQNLHGIPGIMGGLAGVISAASAGVSIYGESIGKVFPERAPSDPVVAAAAGVDPGSDRSASAQAWYQLAALGVTLGMSIVGGLLVGYLCRIEFFEPPKNLYNDVDYWELPEDDEEDEKEHHQNNAELQPTSSPPSVLSPAPVSKNNSGAINLDSSVPVTNPNV